MRPILILTKNLLTERKLQEQLQHLNYEVFCSVNIMKQLKSNPNRLQMLESYQGIIFSETLTNQEIRDLLLYINPEGNLLVRKMMHEPTEQESHELEQMGMKLWIREGEPLDLLREHLAQQLLNYSKKENPQVVFLYQRENTPKTLEEFKSCLTKKECKTFECLLNSEGLLVSREILCSYIWGGSPNNSRLTQISVLVKRLKQKLHDAGFQGELIDTVWGNGYRLSPKLLQYYNQAMVE